MYRTDSTKNLQGNEGNILSVLLMIFLLIPFEEYNFYTLNSVHADEGSAVYEQFLNRYVRLSSTEVAMVEEIENGVRASGRGYATMSTSIAGDPIEAFALMQQTIEAMERESNDNRAINIISSPYNYQFTTADRCRRYTWWSVRNDTK